VDLGECAKKHEYALRADYERAAGTRNLDYEVDVRLIFFSNKKQKGKFLVNRH
jgi:hypothetical protein